MHSRHSRDDVCAANPACRGYCDHVQFTVPIALVMASWHWAHNKVLRWWPCGRTSWEETNSCNEPLGLLLLCIECSGLSLWVRDDAGIGKMCYLPTTVYCPVRVSAHGNHLKSLAYDNCLCCHTLPALMLLLQCSIDTTWFEGNESLVYGHYFLCFIRQN